MNRITNARLACALALLLNASACTRGPMGEAGPMGPSGTNGAPGQGYVGYSTVLEQHFDAQSEGAAPAGWSIGASANALNASISGAIWTSPSRALRLAAPASCFTSAVIPFSVGAGQKLKASFDLYRGEASPAFDIRGFRVLIVAAGSLVGDLFYQAGPSGDELRLPYQGGEVVRPLGSRAYFDRYQVDYDPATQGTDVFINGNPIVSRMPVRTAAPALGGSSSYVELRFSTQAAVVYTLDGLTVKAK